MSDDIAALDRLTLEATLRQVRVLLDFERGATRRLIEERDQLRTLVDEATTMARNYVHRRLSMLQHIVSTAESEHEVGSAEAEQEAALDDERTLSTLRQKANL